MKKIFAILLALVMMLSMVALADTTGTITITNASQGQTYTVYKVFDAHYNATTKTTSYTVKAGDVKDAAAAASDLFVVDTVADSEGNYAVTRKDGATDADVLAWVKANADKFEQVAQAEAASDTVTFDVAYGYYYITSTLGATVTVDTNTPNVSVIDKNTTSPSVPSDKELKVANDDTAEIGDTVKYTVEYTATNFVTDANGNTTQIYQYVVDDTPTAINIDTDSIVIKAGTADITDTATITEGTDGKLNIVIPWATTEDDGSYTSIYASPITLTITYEALVTEKAQDGTISNKVEIKYNDTKFTEDEVELKTYQITVNKVDGEGTALEGAQFELYDAATGGNKIALVKDGDAYRPATAAEQAADGFSSAVIEAGTAVIKGLDGDLTYYLEEIKAPEGYNKLTSRVAVTMNEANATSNVVNNSGSELPSTGGMGTTIFYVVGGLMMAAAVVLLVSKKIVASGK